MEKLRLISVDGVTLEHSHEGFGIPRVVLGVWFVTDSRKLKEWIISEYGLNLDPDRPGLTVKAVDDAVKDYASKALMVLPTPKWPDPRDLQEESATFDRPVKRKRWSLLNFPPVIVWDDSWRRNNSRAVAKRTYYEGGVKIPVWVGPRVMTAPIRSPKDKTILLKGLGCEVEPTMFESVRDAMDSFWYWAGEPRVDMV